jgi:predicted transcriptional regulator
MSTDKTTVYLDAADHRRLKALAAAEDRPTAELIREAVAEYVARRTQRRTPASIGAARSGHGQLSERAEELLDGFGT